MYRSFEILIGIIVGLGACASHAGGDDVDRFIMLHLRGVGTGNETDYVNGSCHRQGNMMKCHLTSTFIMSPKSEDEIRSEIDKGLPGWMHDAKQQTREHLCSYLDMANNSRFLNEPDAKTMNPHNVARAKHLLQHQNETTRAMCDNPSEDNAKAMMRARVEVENAVCDIHSSTYDELFTKQSNDTWVSNSGKPDGLCGTINIGTLKQNSASDTDWTYDAKTINTQPDGPFCGEETHYSEKFISPVNKGARECIWVVAY
jgi:hypothetical protein